MANRFCHDCGSQLLESFNFCEGCGQPVRKKLDSPTVQAQEEQKALEEQQALKEQKVQKEQQAHEEQKKQEGQNKQEKQEIVTETLGFVDSYNKKMANNETLQFQYGQFVAIDITEIGDQSNPFIYPATDDMCNLIEEPWDGEIGYPTAVKGIVVSNHFAGESDYAKAMDTGDAKFDFYVTDSRVIMLCKKYDKGSTWIGFGAIGATAALVGTAVSKVRAAVRSKGTALLGHIRYEWLFAVGYARKEGWLTDDLVQLFYQDSQGTGWFFNIPFPKGTDTEYIANKIMQQASKYRLSMNDEKSESTKRFLERYAKGEKIPQNGDSINKGLCFFPDNYFAPYGEEMRPKKPNRKRY